MRIITTLDPTRLADYRWCAVDVDSYDGADDSPTRHQIGFGRDMEQAKRELMEILETLS